jgi:hypothetical protein
MAFAGETEVEPRTLLVDYLRDELGLTGTKIGCDTSVCGSCTIHLDGQAVEFCTVLAVRVDGCEVTRSKVLRMTASSTRCRRPSGSGTRSSAVCDEPAFDLRDSGKLNRLHLGLHLHGSEVVAVRREDAPRQEPAYSAQRLLRSAVTTAIRAAGKRIQK